MICVKLQGGLGNQMFQAATGYALSKYYNVNLLFDLTVYKKYNVTTSTFTARDYQLDLFQHCFRLAQESDIDFFFPRKKNITTRLSRKLKRFFLSPIIIQESHEKFNLNNNPSKYIYLDGYWQSEKYFKKYRKEIIELFQFPALCPEFLHYKENVLNTNSVSIHIRRGDYVNNSYINSIHGACDLNYYSAAIKLIAKKEKDIKLFFFSDEPAWVRENFKPNQKLCIVETNSSIDDMYLMSLCKHNIIANSSYSWWGAWLNKNNKKIVVAPQKWFVDTIKNEKAKQIIPEEWIVI